MSLRVRQRLITAVACLVVIAIMVGLAEFVVRLAPSRFADARPFSKVKNEYGVVVNGVSYDVWPFWRESKLFAFSLRDSLDISVIPKNGEPAYVVTTNSLGFRFDETLLANSQRKIMLVGDSVTFGHGVSDNQSIAAFLNKTYHRESFLNFGTGGWSFGEYYLTAKHFQERVKPVLRILISYNGNDFEDLDWTAWDGRAEGVLPTAPLRRLDVRVLDYGGLATGSLAYRYPLLRESALWVAIDHLIFSKIREDQVASAIKDNKLSAVETSIQIIQDMQSYGPLLVVAIPSGARGENKEFLNRMSSLPNVPVLNASSLVEEMYSLPKRAKFYLADGVHFTPDGNEKMANFIADFINKNRMLNP